MFITILILIGTCFTMDCGMYYGKQKSKLRDSIVAESNHEITRGELSREIFLFLVQHPDINFDEIMNMKTLMKWNLLDETTEEELALRKYNPFVDCPEFVLDLFIDCL